MKIVLLTLVTFTSTSLLLAQQRNVLPGGIPAEAVRALPTTKPPRTSGSTSNLVNIGARIQVIQPAPGGARAEFGLQKTFFPVDAKGDPVAITTPDGRKLSFRATFLALHDLATGQSLLIAEVTNRTGVIVGDAEVIYTNAFDILNADIRYHYTQQSLEQDIILHENPAIPREFSPENTRLEIWTEWYDSQPVRKTIQTIDLRAKEISGLLPKSLFEDEGLDFGTMKIVAGHAFSSAAQDKQTPVGKSWLRVDGRNWLVETVDYLAVKANLDLLPKSRGSASLSRPKSKREGIVRSLAQASKPAAKTAAKMAMVRARQPRQPEFVMDFVIVSSVPAPADIVSWWPAPSGTNAIDAITNNNYGTLQYGATNGAGKVGQAFTLNGVYSRVRVPDSASLHLTNALTIEVWVYPTSTSSYRDIVSKWDAVGGYNQMSYDLSLYPGGRFYLVVSPGGTGTGSTYVLSTNVVPLNQWTHLAATYDGNNLKLYFNGVFDTDGDYSGNIFPGIGALGIGGTIGGGTGTTVVSPFVGLIDEPTIYKRALGEGEITAIYNAGAAGKHNPTCMTAPADIVAWWPGDGNGYDLARTNFATVSGGGTYESAVVGQGFSFNGTSTSVIAAGDPALNLGANDDITIEAWIAPLPNSTTYDVMSIAGKRYAPNDDIATGYELFLDDGALGFQIGSGSTPVNFIATNNLLNSGYHHVAVTMDRDAVDGGHLYVDGVSVWTFQPTLLSGSLSNAEPFRIGIHPTSGFNGWYKGLIDEVTVYRRALTSTEIASLYAAGSAGKCKVDTDADGLTDLQENFLGTNASDSDTDDDGLTDGDEVFVYHTRPSVADSDGDGVNDGTEISQGRNPLVGAVSDSGNQIRFKIFTPLK